MPDYTPSALDTSLPRYTTPNKRDTEIVNMIRREIRAALTEKLLTEYITKESINPRKIRGLGADGEEGFVLALVQDSSGRPVPQWVDPASL